jgi:MotA/TolQ/ExbB proton channel family.
MKKFDWLTSLGLFCGVLVFVFGVAYGNGFDAFIQFLDIQSVIITMGGTTAALFVSFSPRDLKQMFIVIKQAFSDQVENLNELIDLFVRLSDRARREGLLALEAEMENVDNEFIKKGILLAIDGIESDVIIDIMSAEISAMEERHAKGRSLLEKAGEYAPAWGMIGTLIGLILMLNRLNDPSQLGPALAVALITTLYGSLLANLVFLPLANKLSIKTEKEVFIKQVIIEGVIGVQSGQNPKLLEEKLSVFLSNEDKKVREQHHAEEAS